MEKTTIMFDMYGVIIEESKGNFIPYTYAHFKEKEYIRLTRQLKKEQLFTRAGNGELTSDEFLTALGYTDPKATMTDYIDNHLTLVKGFVEFAEKYHDVYDFILVSNDVSEWSEYITTHYDLNRFFKKKIVSGDVKCRKPDRKIYEIALEVSGKDPKECFFVDNSVKNLTVAEELGIEPILFNRDNEDYSGSIVNTFAELQNFLTSKM